MQEKPPDNFLQGGGELALEPITEDEWDACPSFLLLFSTSFFRSIPTIGVNIIYT